MQILKMNIMDLHSPEKNVRIHTENQINEFVRSIEMFGQIRPVVVDENNVILAGNGLVTALQKAGIDSADVYKICNLSENQKKKLMIADNKIFGLGIENLETLNSFLEDLSGDLDIPGFDEEILRSMVAEADSATEKLSQYGTLDEEEIQTIRENAERKEERIATSASGDVKPTDETDAEHPTEPIRQSVKCPECGCTVWL
jgi:ParB-like chromosome segregation protein Spo0J